MGNHEGASHGEMGVRGKRLLEELRKRSVGACRLSSIVRLRESILSMCMYESMNKEKACPVMPARALHGPELPMAGASSRWKGVLMSAEGGQLLVKRWQLHQRLFST